MRSRSRSVTRMRGRRTTALLGVLWLGLGIAPSAAAPLTIDEAVREAVANNRDLHAAYHAIAEARARLLQAGLWANPSLQLSGTHDFAFSSDGEYTASAGFEQRFPVAGRLARARDLARVDVAIALAEVRDATRRLIGEVETAAIDLLLRRAQVVARADLIGQARQLANVSEARAKLGEVSALDVNTARLELERLGLERRTFAVQAETSAAELNRLLGRAPEATLEIADPTPPVSPPALHLLTERALARRPDLQQARLAADRAHAERALAVAERWEDWAVGLSYDRDHQVVDGAPPQGAGQFLGLHVTVPLPLWNQNQGRVAEAEARDVRARDKTAALELAIRAELTAAHRRVEELGQAVASYQAEVGRLADENVRLAHEGYRQALVGVVQVLQAQRQHAELRIGRLDALAQYRRAVVDLETISATHPLLDGPEGQP